MANATYRAEMENYERAAWIARRMNEAVYDETLGEKTARFITLTSRIEQSAAWWRENLQNFVDDFLVGELGRSGLYSLEHHKSGALHCHMTVVILLEQLQYLELALEQWRQNVGFTHHQEVRSMIRICGYITKTLHTAEYEGVEDVLERVADGNVTYFGPRWDQKVGIPDLDVLELAN